MGKTLNRRDDTFCKLVAQEREAPGFSYAKSRNREYKGFNDDNAARNLLKSEAIQDAVNTYKNHTIKREIAGRTEILTMLTRILRSPGPMDLQLQIDALLAQKMDKEVRDSHIKKLDFSGIRKPGKNKNGYRLEGYDKVKVAAEILRLSGVDISKPISDEGKRTIRETLTEIYRDMSGNDGD